MKIGDPKEVGVKLRNKRLELGFTLREMAEATGLSFVTLIRLEHGKLGYIHSDTFRKLEALQIKQDDIKKKVMMLVPKPAEPIRPSIRLKAVETGDIQALPSASKILPAAVESRRRPQSFVLRAIKRWVDHKLAVAENKPQKA